MVPDAVPQRPADRGVPRPQLPPTLARVSYASVSLLVGGLGLMAVSFFSNPVPDPSFPWATLPESFRLAYTQPRIEHWPVTYTLGLWLVVVTLPLVLVNAYDRFGERTSFHPSTYLAALPVALMLGLTTYCRFFWPKLQPPT